MRDIQDVFKSERDAWVDEARAAARRLLTRRHYITIDEVLAEAPRPNYIHRNTTGQVFKHPDFKKCGYIQSKNRLANGRYIFQWTLADDMPLTMQQIRRSRQVAQ